nr:immunoglobulin light chain junction region [Macaca mulatta]MOV77890.1 immunoglobulin light chain junction region [Macaca mulatta]MOV78224.1 immunoglobulin light chain junction region [Macaca mulatta]MOV78757.1 immunoglobulin light chain junction region [Macaca mulatta]MOV79229.1 immunoglobulin light chain junction region [Macaca mulatta]
CQQSYRYPLTF